MADCIVPYGPNAFERRLPIIGRPPAWPRQYASMIDPAAIQGLGRQEYVDFSTLNNRFRYAPVAGLGGGVGAGSLGGSVVGSTGLGATPPNVVCQFMQYECQNWNSYDAETQGEIIKVANQAAAQHASAVKTQQANTQQIALQAEAEAQSAYGESDASVKAAEAALAAAQKCDLEIALAMIGESQNHHAAAEDHAGAAGQLANDAYKIAGTGSLAQDQLIVAAAENAAASASAASSAVISSETARMQVIGAAQEAAKKCGGTLPLPEPEPVKPPPGKAGEAHAGLLWLGLGSLAAVGIWALTRKKK